MGKIPFTIRPIRLDEAIIQTEPLSLQQDLSGKVTLSSKHASLYFSELAATLQTKDVAQIVSERASEEVILSTNTILQLSRAKDVPEGLQERKFLVIPLFFGFLGGMFLILILQENHYLLVWVTAFVTAFFGGMIGFIWREFYEMRVKKFAQNIAKNILDE